MKEPLKHSQMKQSDHNQMKQPLKQSNETVIETKSNKTIREHSQMKQSLKYC